MAVTGLIMGVDISGYSDRPLPVVSMKSFYATPAINIDRKLLAGFLL